MKRIIVFLMCIVLSVYEIAAQELTLKSLSIENGDMAASQYIRYDLSNMPCGLVKIQLDVEGAEFEGNVIGQTEYKAGEYWVYMSEGSYMLKVKHPQFVPLDINFRDYNIMRVGGRTTYRLVLYYDTSKPISSMVGIETITVNGVSFNMVKIGSGTFMMGDDDSEVESGGEKPAHQVSLTGYEIGETEVTQELWEAVMGSNPSRYRGANLPVEQVNWDDCQTFINKLNEMTGRQFRLPTEAEWEFAACCGMKSRSMMYRRYNTIDKTAWYSENSGKRTHEVKTKRANEFGLYDMSGNVWEWCQDKYKDYQREPQSNPVGTIGFFRVSRGGGWQSNANQCRPAYRFRRHPTVRFDDLGLRLAL